MFDISLSDASCTLPSSGFSRITLTIFYGLTLSRVCVAIVYACLPIYRPLFDPKVRRNKNQTSVVEVFDTGRRPFSMEKP